MRGLAPFGLMVMTGCGLGMGGLGADLLDAAQTGDAASGGGEAVAPPQDDAGGSAGENMPATPDEGGGTDEASAPPSVDAAGGGEMANDAAEGAAAPVDLGDASHPGVSGDSNADAAIPGASDAADAGATTAEAGPPCTDGIPTGWSLVILDLGSAACPTDFTSHDVSGPPVVGAGACACTCAVTEEGACTEGTLTVMDGPTCARSYFTATVSGPGCLSAGAGQTVPVSAHAQGAPLAAQGGSCSSGSQADPTQISAPAVSYCDVPASSAENVCGGVPPPGFAACVATSGDVPCPAGTPFVGRQVVEDGATLLCTPCSCTVSTTCLDATVTEYADPSCQGNPVASFTVDGTCDVVEQSGEQGSGSWSSVEYAATASSTCMAATSTGTAQLANPQTICCR
jgi:hypothetical protein